MNLLVLRTALVFVVSSSGSCLAADDPDLAWGKWAWEAGSFTDASARLSAFKTRTGSAPNYPVDYMLATSWCRIPGMQKKGAALLDWLATQQIGRGFQRQVVAERQVCASTAASRPLPLEANKQGATIKSQGRSNPVPKKRAELPA